VAVLIVIIIFVLIGLIVLVVGAPLRAAAAARERPDDGLGRALEHAEGGVRRDELEAAREAKYKEIRDAEMDFRTGKLSEADYRLLDGELRTEALAILDSLDALAGEGDGPEDA